MPGYHGVALQLSTAACQNCITWMSQGGYSELSYLKMKKKKYFVMTNGTLFIRVILIIILSDVKSIWFYDTKQ